MRLLLALLLACLLPAPLWAQFGGGEQPEDHTGDGWAKRYFAAQTKQIQSNSLREIQTLEDWNKQKDTYRLQLFEMLGLDPQRERTPLEATTTGKLDHAEFTVENVHFQSSPKLYVTGNLYLPKNVTGKAPAILYVCGHGGVKKNGVSYGNKVHYQHHGAWYARHGYVCLVIDSLQLGEIEALHHGLYREKMWWWTARGYTPAGVEAWNCMRALDYLQARPEVDGEKLGVTGRSGGGAYSWWIAALDERIKAAVPVAGITDLQNHVVDGCVTGHCDCMYMNNTYQWDYDMVAALVAPRPLVVSNTDRDPIFPLDGVYRTFVGARRIYDLHKATDKIAFNITSGGHVDTQELQMQAFRWFDHHLLGVDRAITKPAVPFFQMEQLQVFKKLPEDQINTTIQETFVPAATAPQVPVDAIAWKEQSAAWREQLKTKVFRAWPEVDHKPSTVLRATQDKRDNLVLTSHVFKTQDEALLTLYVLRGDNDKPLDLVVLNVLDQTGWDELLATLGSKFDNAFGKMKLPPADEEAFHSVEQLLTKRNWAFAYIAPRGIGPTAWTADEKNDTHQRRRYVLLGQTLDGMRAWDVHAAARTLRNLPGYAETPLWLQSHREMAGVTLAAGVMLPDVYRLDLYDLPTTLRNGPIFFNAQRYLDMPTLVALAAENSRVVLYDTDAAAWEYPQQVVDKLGWDKKQLQVRVKSAKE